jgi:hypothetical protein
VGLDVSSWTGVVANRPLEGGHRNEVWSGWSPDGRVVIRRSRRDAASLAWELQLLGDLAAAGFLVPSPVASDAGTMSVDGVVVQHWVEGGEPESSEDWMRVADELRRLHREFVGYPQRPGCCSVVDLNRLGLETTPARVLSFQPSPTLVAGECVGRQEAGANPGEDRLSKRYFVEVVRHGRSLRQSSRGVGPLRAVSNWSEGVRPKPPELVFDGRASMWSCSLRSRARYLIRRCSRRSSHALAATWRWSCRRTAGGTRSLPRPTNAWLWYGPHDGPSLVPGADIDADIERWLLRLSNGIRQRFEQSKWPTGSNVCVCVEVDSRVTRAGGWHYFK